MEKNNSLDHKMCFLFLVFSLDFPVSASQEETKQYQAFALLCLPTAVLGYSILYLRSLCNTLILFSLGDFLLTKWIFNFFQLKNVKGLKITVQLKSGARR